jgi:hypothetical protein
MRFLLPLALLGLTGCATITRGTHDVLVVQSEPTGAHVVIKPDGGECNTPCTMKLKRKGTYEVDINRTGYEPVMVKVQPQIVGAGAAGMAGNVLVGGVIGAVVDGTSGAMKDLRPNPVTVNLVKLEPAPTSSPPAAVSSPVAAADAVVTPAAASTIVPASTAGSAPQ